VPLSVASSNAVSWERDATFEREFYVSFKSKAVKKVTSRLATMQAANQRDSSRRCRETQVLSKGWRAEFAGNQTPRGLCAKNESFFAA